MERFWSDDFDMDLLKVIPGVVDALGATADVELFTHGHTTYGRLNHPSCWNTYEGSAAFFGTRRAGDWKADFYDTTNPIVVCTWLEALRDAWPHDYVLLVDRVPVWDTARLSPIFQDLMFDLRGWRALPDGRADNLKRAVLAQIRRATERLQNVLLATEGAR